MNGIGRTLAHAVYTAHQADSECGYRLLRDEAVKAGYHMSRHTAWALCSANKWHSSMTTKPSYSKKRPGPAVHDDLVQRHFHADELGHRVVYRHYRTSNQNWETIIYVQLKMLAHIG